VTHRLELYPVRFRKVTHGDTRNETDSAKDGHTSRGQEWDWNMSHGTAPGTRNQSKWKYPTGDYIIGYNVSAKERDKTFMQPNMLVQHNRVCDETGLSRVLAPK
jgi:hypothetical protein